MIVPLTFNNYGGLKRLCWIKRGYVKINNTKSLTKLTRKMAAVNNQQSCLQVNKYTGIIILLLLHLSCAVVIYVDTCPSDTESWVERSKKFLCKDPNEIYHCIQTISGHVVETCMKNYVIKTHKVGCPWVRIHNRISHLHYPFLKCNMTNHDCPKLFHREYTTNELYLYPACIFPGVNTTSIRDSVKEINTTFNCKEIHTSDLLTGEPYTIGYILLYSIGTFIFGICLGSSVKWIYVHLWRVLPVFSMCLCTGPTSYNLQGFASVRNNEPSEVVSMDKTDEPCQSEQTRKLYSLSPEDNRSTECNDHASDKTIRARNITTSNTAEQELPDNAESYTNGVS